MLTHYLLEILKLRMIVDYKTSQLVTFWTQVTGMNLCHEVLELGEIDRLKART